MLPHITNSQAGVNKWDYVSSALYEVYFTLPEALRTDFGQDEAVLTEHVLSISGLDALHRTADTTEQKFMGTTRSFIKSTLDSTTAEIEVKFTLNLRNRTDNFIYRLFKAWSRLGYDINTGEKQLKKDYLADYLRVVVANRAGDIYEDITFKDVMLNGSIDGPGTYDYSTDEPLELTVKFKSDWWTDTDAIGSAD